MQISVGGVGMEEWVGVEVHAEKVVHKPINSFRVVFHSENMC